MMPVLQEGLYANRFVSDDGKETIYTLYNAAEKAVEGELIRVDQAAEAAEIWKAKPLENHDGIIRGSIEAGEVLVIALRS